MEVGDRRVNPAAIVALIGDLYSQIQALLGENQALKERVSQQDIELAASGHTHGPNGEHI